MAELSLTHSAIEKTISNISRKASNIGSAKEPKAAQERKSSSSEERVDGDLEKAETQADEAAKRAKKEELSRIESEVIYPKGIAVGLIMLSLYLAIFLIALVWNLFPIVNLRQRLIAGAGSNHHRHRHPFHHQ